MRNPFGACARRNPSLDWGCASRTPKGLRFALPEGVALRARGWVVCYAQAVPEGKDPESGGVNPCASLSPTGKGTAQPETRARGAMGYMDTAPQLPIGRGGGASIVYTSVEYPTYTLIPGSTTGICGGLVRSWSVCGEYPCVFSPRAHYYE